MVFDYEKLEEELKESCEEINQEFLIRFNNDVYISAGGSKLETFINELQKDLKILQKHL